MSAEMNTENNHDLVFQGTKEAIDMELQRLRMEEQLKHKVKQQKNAIVMMYITVAILTLLLLLQIISRYESRAYERELQQTKVRIEQLVNECQRLIELKLKDQQQDTSVNDNEEFVE